MTIVRREYGDSAQEPSGLAGSGGMGVRESKRFADSPGGAEPLPGGRLPAGTPGQRRPRQRRPHGRGRRWVACRAEAAVGRRLTRRRSADQSTVPAAQPRFPNHHGRGFIGVQSGLRAGDDLPCRVDRPGTSEPEAFLDDRTRRSALPRRGFLQGAVPGGAQPDRETAHLVVRGSRSPEDRAMTPTHQTDHPGAGALQRDATLSDGPKDAGHGCSGSDRYDRADVPVCRGLRTRRARLGGRRARGRRSRSFHSVLDDRSVSSVSI